MLRRAAALAGAGLLALSAQTWGAATAWLSLIGADMEAVDHAEYARARSIAAGQGMEAKWDAEEASGRQRSIDEALALAVAPIPISPGINGQADPAASALPEGLSRREVEVLRLVASGLTNAEISRQLVLSPRTVQAHLYSIYQKVGVSTRHAAAHYARRHGLAE